jgi:hypothetical protein
VLPENRPGNSASQKLEIINGYGMDFASIKDFWVNTYFYNASYSESSILMLVTYSVLSSSCYLSRWSSVAMAPRYLMVAPRSVADCFAGKLVTRLGVCPSSQSAKPSSFSYPSLMPNLAEFFTSLDSFV